MFKGNFKRGDLVRIKKNFGEYDLRNLGIGDKFIDFLLERQAGMISSYKKNKPIEIMFRINYEDIFCFIPERMIELAIKKPNHPLTNIFV